MSPTNLSHVLIVDDDTVLLQALVEALQPRMDAAVVVDTADSASAVLECITNTDYDAIASDITMPGMDGQALLARIRVLRPDTPVLLMGSYGEHDLAMQALHHGAYDFIQKPIDPDSFAVALTRAIQMRQLRRRVEEQRLALEQHASSVEEAVRERTHELLEANQAKDELLELRGQALAAAEKAQQRLALLVEASEILASSFDYHATLSDVAPLTVPRIADWCLVDTVEEDGSIHWIASAHADRTKEHLVRELQERCFLQGKVMRRAALCAGRSRVIPEVTDADITTIGPSDEYHEHLRALAPKSYMCVPMIARGRIMGAISFISSHADRRYSSADLTLAEDLGRRAAVAVENGQLYQKGQVAIREQEAARHQVEALAEQLRQQASELDTIFEAMADGVYVCDRRAYLTRVNKMGAEFFGFTVEEALAACNGRQARSNIEVLRMDGTPMSVRELPVLQALRGRVGTDYRAIIRRTDTRREVHLQISSAPIRDRDGKVIGAVSVARDVTQLDKLERQKEEFLGVVSHELKTPLTTLKGLAQIARRRIERSTGPVDAQLIGIERAVGRMEALINDLLDISRIESGKLALRTEHCDLLKLCQQTVEEQAAATDRVITLITPAEPLEVVADVNRVGQVLANLVSNALKYSPHNESVTVTLNRVAHEAIVSVQDKGSGIPHAELAHIFERFYRVPEISVQSGSGVGLGIGLYIAREITERHGGRIWAKSSPGEGSTFYVALPVVAPVGEPSETRSHTVPVHP